MNEEIIEKARTMTAVLPYSKEAIEFMISRGFDTPAKIRNFLEFNPAMLRSMPLMNDAGRFIARVLEAVIKNISLSMETMTVTVLWALPLPSRSSACLVQSAITSSITALPKASA